MKSRFTYLPLFIAGLFANLAAAQTLIEDTNIELLTKSSFPPFTQLRVFQDIEASDQTNIWFSIDSGPSPELVTLTFEMINLDEGSDWYFVQENDVFSESSIANGTHNIWGGVNETGDGLVFGEIDVPIGEFYLGVNTGRYPSLTLPRDVFGWARFSIDSDLNLQLLDNAVAYNSNQIIVGSNAIPEPSTTTGCILFLASILLNRRRRNR